MLMCVLGASPAAAECPKTAVFEALGLRVDQATLSKLVDVGLDFLPEDLPLPPTDWEIFSCPFETAASVGTTDTNLQVEVLSYNIALEADALRVEAQLNLRVDGAVEARLCDIPTDCQLRATARQATLSGRVRPAIDQCELRTEFEDVKIEVDSEQVDIELSDCVIVSSVIDFVLWGFQSIILEAVIPFLEDYIVQDLPALIRDSEIGVVLPSYSALGVDVTVAPDGLQFGSDSVQLSARAWSAPSGPPAACVSPDRGLELGIGPALPLNVVLGEGENARLVASQPFLQQLLLSAWGSGLFCFDLEALGVDLQTPLEPIFPGVEISTAVRSASAPALSLDQLGEQDLVIEVSELEADVELSLPGDDPVVALAETGARIAGRVVVDPASTSIAIEPIDLEVRPARVDLPQRSLEIRPEGVEQLFDDTLAPLVFGDTGRLVILDAIFAGAPVGLELVRVEAQPTLLEAGLRVWAKTPGDLTPPTTVLANAPRGPVSSTIPIEAASTDDFTPASMMRHQVTVDGLVDETLRAGQRFTLLGLMPGPRRVELRAIDLNDNVGEPVALELFVDTTPPELELIEAPLGVINRSSAEWRLRAVDNHSPEEALTASYELQAWGSEAEGRRRLAEGSFSLAEPLRLEDLPEDRILAVRFVVEDQAGNTAEMTSSFAVDTAPTLGCTSTSGEPTWALFFGLLLFLRKPRRTRGD